MLLKLKNIMQFCSLALLLLNSACNTLKVTPLNDMEYAQKTKLLNEKVAKYNRQASPPIEVTQCTNATFLQCMNIDSNACLKIYKVAVYDCRHQTKEKFKDQFSLKNSEQYKYTQHCIGEQLLNYSFNRRGAKATKSCLDNPQ